METKDPEKCENDTTLPPSGMDSEDACHNKRKRDDCNDDKTTLIHPILPPATSLGMNGNDRAIHHEQNDAMTESSNNNVSNKKAKRQSTKKKHMDPAVLKLRQTIQQCCATNDLSTAIRAYDRAITDGIKIEAQSFYNLLNLCDGLANRSLHIGTPKPQQHQRYNHNKDGSSNDDDQKQVHGPPENDNTAEDSTENMSTHNLLSNEPYQQQEQQTLREEVDLETRKKYAEGIKKRMDELQLPLTETAYTALIRLVSKCGDTDEAEKLMNEAEAVQQCRPKLRMYSSLIRKYCEMDGKIVHALKIWLRVCRQGLILSEKEYCVLLQGACKAGHAAVFERVLSDLAEDVLVPSQQTRNSIVEWFKSPVAVLKKGDTSTNNGDGMDPNHDDIKALLETIKVPCPSEFTKESCMGPVQTDREGGWTMDGDCTIDKLGILQSGCLKGCSLKPVKTSPQAWDEMKRLNEQIVTSGRADGDSSLYQGGKKGPKMKLNNQVLSERQRQWDNFQRYLGRRKNKFDVVIDGANVGYYESNFAGAPKHVDYNKIDWMVKHFLEKNQSVLLVLHSRHFSRNIMPQRFDPIQRSWRKSGVLYSTPPGMNDDWFWLHAALLSGPGTLVVTNDEMRDHFFQMLAPRSFVRWKDRHQIRFDFGAFDAKERQRPVQLHYPEPYSRRIQRIEDGLVIPLPKRGDGNRFLDGSHVADSDDIPEHETYFCIRPKS